MFKTKLIIILILISSFIIGNELTLEEQRIIREKVLHEFAQAIWTQAMEAKQAFNTTAVREEPIENFATTAPRSEFIVNADISSDLQEGTESATVYVSTDGQATWQSAGASLIGTEGYETTWGGTISTGGGNSAYSYLSGIVNSAALGEEYDYGTIIVSGSPHNVNGNWPPGSNLYALLATDESGDASSNYDITAIRGTYKGQDAEDEEGNTYTDVERFYLSLSLSGGCCDEGGLFGPWYLYGVGIVNPDAEEAVAYAIGYGDGGFGQLSPGLLKITGDLSTGEIGGFDYITENIDYSTAGNDMQATALMSYITDDSQWGTWPNSFNGFIVLGVSVEASLDGLDVAADILDQTDPGLMICETTYQTGNNDPVLTEPAFDTDTSELSITYTDEDGNLPWWRNVQVCYPDGGVCFLNIPMIPDSHTYLGGVRYSASLVGEDIDDGLYETKFWFSDDMPGEPQVHLDITIGGAGSCDLLGDSNDDGNLNVLDVVLLVNIVLAGEFNECADLNADESLNVLDIVLLVNIILQG